MYSKAPQETGGGGTHPTGYPAAQRPLTPEDVARASQVLVNYMGPIAPVLAKRAAKPDTTRDLFIAALAAHLREDAARARFIDALR